MTSKFKILFLGLVIVLLAIGPSFTAPAQAQTQTELKLPPGAIKLSPAVPAMGEHWADPKNLPLGPIYLVWQNKVIGVEYMFTLAMMQRVAVTTPAGEQVSYGIGELPIFSQKIDHLTISYMPDGHSGFEVPHYDVHLYLITPADRYKIGLNVPPPPAVAPVPEAAKPSKAVQTSPVIPAMGSHWSDPSHRPFGPIYTIDKAGKETGLEYSYNHNKMRSARIPEGDKMIWDCSIDYVPVGRTVDHMTIDYLPRGRGADTAWRFDLHLFSVTPEEKGRIAP